MSVRVLGIKETIKELKDLGPDIQKQFRRDVRLIVKPIIDAAKAEYDGENFPSGTARKWKTKFPLEASKAKSGLRPGITTAKRNRSTILVIQKNAGASVFEFANTGSLGAAFRQKNGAPPRVIWPSADKQLPQVVEQMTELIDRVAVMVNRRIS